MCRVSRGRLDTDCNVCDHGQGGPQPEHIVISTKYNRQHPDNIKVKAKKDHLENAAFTEKVREEALRGVEVENLEDLREKVRCYTKNFESSN